jgi:hypothetical protein
MEAITNALATLNRYPDPTCAALRRRLADRHGVPANRITIGNGSCDVLLAAGEALLEPGAEIVYAWPSFSIYPHLAAASGARAIEVTIDAEHRHDLEAMRREITVATRLVIVCNPNNPTSTALPLDEIAAFVADLPRHVCVILDEAYCEFNMLQDPDESIPLLDKHPNLVLLRTFSKIYGLCGLRVGYALCGSEEFRTAVDQVRQPFFCNAAAQAAASEALNTRTRSFAAWSGIWPSGSGSRTACASSGSSRPSRRPTSCGSISARIATRATSSAAWPSGACSCGRGRRSAARGRFGSRSARRPRTSASSRRSARCSDAGSMELASRSPHPALAGHVRSLAGWHERADGPVRRAELPAGGSYSSSPSGRRWTWTGAGSPRSWPVSTTRPP